MDINEDLSNGVREIEHLWIPMPDGARLAARLWLPENPDSLPVPAILEYLPYRKSDMTVLRDMVHHRWFAGQGYACLRVDLRGSGDSDGVLTDEYLWAELMDGVAVIEWIARQPWCSGDVGMMGISWGGFNGLQIAALRPPALKAVISICSTDDRYADDVHYMGGCLLLENLSWAGTMLAYNSLPPHPEVAGESWRRTWLERLEGSGLWAETWTRRQTRDDYWRHGSICEDWSAIQCPVYAVGGWVDGYSNSIFRLMEHLPGTKKGLIGPWAHRYPHMAQPGPAIGFLQEALRWWDQWLKGEDTGILDEPQLRVWMQEPAPPSGSHEIRPGRWVAEPGWPSQGIATRSYRLGDGRLLEDRGEAGGGPEEATAIDVRSPLWLGLRGGRWCGYAYGPDQPTDQRLEDGGATVFETGPLEESTEILGQPLADLCLAADRPQAQVVVRLTDVAPSGAATRVSYGMLNLSHRDGHETPEPLRPGTVYAVRVPLNEIAHRFAVGHRIRLAISTSYWPLAWPAPEPVTLRLDRAPSRFSLPVRPPRREDAALPAFAAPEGARGAAMSVLEPARQDWRVIHDLGAGTQTLEIEQDGGLYRLDEAGLVIGKHDRERYLVADDDIRSLQAETRNVRRLSKGDWSIRTDARQTMAATATAFHIEAELEAFEGKERVFHKAWNVRIPRNQV